MPLNRRILLITLGLVVALGGGHAQAAAAALKNAGVPVEMHLHAQGGHAFALRPNALPITRWPQLVDQWLGTIGMMRK
jgi:acetyl esterase/lipase